MKYGRAYVLGGVVIALHASNEPISIIVMDGCDMFDLTMTQDITYAELAYANGAVTGPGVSDCMPV